MTDAWEENRDRQLERWAALPAARRVEWLEDAVAAAFRSGALPRTKDTEPPLPPLTGADDLHERGALARREVLARVSDFFRGPAPSDVDTTRFAETSALVQFALWRETDAAFWCKNERTSVPNLIALARERARK
jgi:hypothetical protein